MTHPGTHPAHPTPTPPHPPDPCNPTHSPSHHHKYPMDFDRLVFPPLPAALVMGIFYALLHALAPVVGSV